jgi:hypothetical protein
MYTHTYSIYVCMYVDTYLHTYATHTECIHTAVKGERNTENVYLLYLHKSTSVTCFTSTKVPILAVKGERNTEKATDVC